MVRRSPREAKPTPVPWVIQNIFPDYHGVAWYWRSFQPPTNPHRNGRYLLKFEAVDYFAQVWVNGSKVGEHEIGETPFTFDVTDAIRLGQRNLLAVRVLNPSQSRRIDGYILRETPSDHKSDLTASNYVYNSGGIVGTVELLMVPTIRITDLHIQPDWTTGQIQIKATVMNAGTNLDITGLFRVDPAAGGATIATNTKSMPAGPGENIIETSLTVPGHQLWTPDTPLLYRVTASVQAVGSPSVDQHSVRCGFRDFRFDNGYFQLNGRRILPKGLLYVPYFPITYTFPHDPELLKRDVRFLKMCGYNFVRLAFRAMPQLVELCDEAGLLVYQEHYGSWMLKDSANMKSRFNASISEVVRRDRNHPSIVMWGLLNETAGNDPVYLHAKTLLPMMRQLDPTRVIILDSGGKHFKADNGLSNPGTTTWFSDYADIHPYPFTPVSPAIINGQLRGAWNNSAKTPTFISEFGNCGTMNLVSDLKQFKLLGQEQSDDARFFQWMMDRFMTDWKHWRLDEIWAVPENYFKDGHKAIAKIREPGETAIRANPSLIAYSPTHMTYDTFCGHGFTTVFRELKDPSLIDSARLTTAPLRWCLFATPHNSYKGGRVRFEAVLADEDTLPSGTYPVRVEILGPDKKAIIVAEH